MRACHECGRELGSDDRFCSSCGAPAPPAADAEAGGGVVFVGRRYELEQLREALQRARDTSTAQLVTVLGPPGLGKTTLAELLVAGAHGTRRLGAACAEYGEEPPLAPLRRALVAAGLDRPDAVAGLLPDGPDRGRLVGALAGLYSDAPVDAASLRWSVRRALEALAAEQPLLLVLDDVHRADAFLLDLLEHVGGAGGAAITVVCLARPELLERRPDWGEGERHAFALRLAPLADDEAGALLDALGGAPAASRPRLVETAAGNPLFLEQLLALARSTGGLSSAPSLESLIAARLELLPERERHALERAAVHGLEFHVERVGADAPDLDRGAFERLAQKALLREAGAQAYRFRHSVVHAAAYEGSPPALRAELHERLAGDAREPALLNFHLERAARRRAETPADAAAARAAAARAADSLFEAALDSLSHGTPASGIELLERAASLLDAHEPRRAELLAELGRTLVDSGETARGRHALEQARELGDARVRARAQLALLRLEGAVGGDEPGWAAAAAASVEELVPVLRDAGDERGLARARLLLAELLDARGQAAAALELARSAQEHAARAGDVQLASRCLLTIADALVRGPATVAEGIAELERALSEQRPLAVEVGLLARLAALYAMQGDADAAHERLERATTLAEEAELEQADLQAWRGRALLSAGDGEAAERELRRALDGAEGVARAPLAALRAEALLPLDRVDEALRAAELARDTAAGDDVYAQLLWRAASARALARQGRHEQAVALARAAVACLDRTDLLDAVGDGELALAETLGLAGEAREAAAAAERAREYYEAKGDRSSEVRARRLAEQLAAEPLSQGA